MAVHVDGQENSEQSRSCNHVRALVLEQQNSCEDLPFFVDESYVIMGACGEPDGDSDDNITSYIEVRSIETLQLIHSNPVGLVSSHSSHDMLLSHYSKELFICQIEEGDSFYTK